MPLNKNEAARVRRVQQSIDKVLDALHSAQGQLYPQGLKPYRDAVQAIISQADKLAAKITADLPKTSPRKPQNPQQLDIEDEGFDDPDEDRAA